MFIKSIIFFTIVGVVSPLIYSAYKYVRGELKTGSYGDDELLYTMFPIGGGMLGAAYFITIPIFIICFIVSFLLNTIKNKIGNSSLDDELRKKVHNTMYAKGVFRKISHLKQSKFSSGMMLEQYERELEQVVLTIGTPTDYDYNGFNIPRELLGKYEELVKEFSDLVDIAGEQITKYEDDERKKIADVNLEAMDKVHKLLIAVKKDKLEGKV